LSPLGDQAAGCRSRTPRTRYADALEGKVVVDPSNPVGIDEDGNLYRTLPEDESAASVVAGPLPAGAHYAKAFGTLLAESLAEDEGGLIRRSG
jgi:predicted dinucleotide-binding enzyme